MDFGARGILLARRLAGYFVDALLLFALVVASQYLLLALGLHPFRDLLSDGGFVEAWPLHGWVFASTTLPFVIYFTVGFVSGATLGQRLLRISVRGRDGGKLGLAHATLRAVVMLLPFEFNHTIMFHAAPWTGGAPELFIAGITATWAFVGIYLLLPLLRRDGRSVHDLASGAVVARR